ncbi:MAG: glycosyltransferase family 2 protein [Candidatus Levybacteria bacterium]|nr:glycosyltransferase family 2 protein [Candidatus Levybacteria bacterium]
MKKLSIIIPVFNEEKTIVEVLNKVSKIKIPNTSKEIIVVDDGSTDATASKIRSAKLADKIRNLKIFRHTQNLGKGAAVKTGIRNSTGDYVVIQDADLEYDPLYIPILLRPIQQHKSEVVYGTRLKRMPDLSKDEKNPRFLLHYIGNRLLSLITSILYGQWITDMETCYKVFPKKAVENIILKSRRFDFEPEITAKLLKKGYRIDEIPITSNPRDYNEGKKLNTIKDGAIALFTILKCRFID